MKEVTPLPFIKCFESGSIREDFLGRHYPKLSGMAQIKESRCDGVNQCLSSFSIDASLQSVRNNFMPHPRSVPGGCRQGTVRLAAPSSSLLEEGALKVPSAKLPRTPRHKCCLSQRCNWQGMNVKRDQHSVWSTAFFSDLTFRHVCSIALHQPQLNPKQRRETWNHFCKASASNSAGGNWTRAGRRLGWWASRTEPTCLNTWGRARSTGPHVILAAPCPRTRFSPSPCLGAVRGISQARNSSPPVSHLPSCHITSVWGSDSSSPIRSSPSSDTLSFKTKTKTPTLWTESKPHINKACD